MTPAEVNAVTKTRRTALHAAAFKGHIKCCGVLIAAGASLDTKTKGSKTPLMLAPQEHPSNAALWSCCLAAGRGTRPAWAATCAAVCLYKCGGVSADGMMMTCIAF